jgi:uncharacterized protein
MEVTPSFDEKVGSLLRPTTYPEPTGHVEPVQTNMSWVFLTEHFAYKLKKPVKSSFLDYSTVERRKHFCEEEVRLNRRLASSVYLGTIALRWDLAGMSLGGRGTVIDWLVKMRRLPRERFLDRALLVHAYTDAELTLVAQRLAEFYAHAESVLLTPREYLERIEADVALNGRALTEAAAHLSPEDVRFVQTAQVEALHDCAALFERRVMAGRIIEGHGDLRPEHVWLAPDPQIIDCLEFDLRYRTLDPAEELSFLSVECEFLGGPAVGAMIAQGCFKAMQDAPPERLLDFYKCYRATLRSKLSIWHLRDPNVREPERWPRQARRYLDIAITYAQRLKSAQVCISATSESPV